MKNNQISIMKNCHIPDFENQSLPGHVGSSNECRKFHSKTSVAESKTPLPKWIEETIPAYDNAFYDIKFEETGDQMRMQNLSLKKSLMMLMSMKISRMAVF